MKKRIVMIICFSLLLLCLMTSTVKVSADSSSHPENSAIEFSNFTFSSTKIRSNYQQKVKITCTFDTNEPIIISKIHYEIESQNGTVENYDKKPSKEQICSFVVEDWQIGTLKLSVTYELCDEYGTPLFDGGEYVKEFYLAANSKWKEEIKWPSAILLGFFTMVCVVCATSIVISSSKEEKIIKELDEEE